MNSFQKLLTYGYDFESSHPPYGFNSYDELPNFTLPIRSLTASSSVLDVRFAVIQSQLLRASTPLALRGHGVIFNLIRERHYRYIVSNIKGRLSYLDTCPSARDIDSEAAIDLDYRINVFVLLHRIALLRSGFIACVTDSDPFSIMTDTLIDDDDPGLESYAKQLELCSEIFRNPFDRSFAPEHLRCDFLEISAASHFEVELESLFERKAHLEYRLGHKLRPVVWTSTQRYSSAGVSPATPGHNTQVLPACLSDAPGHLSNVHASSVTRDRHIDFTKVDCKIDALSDPVDRTIVASSTVMAPGHFASAISVPATSTPVPGPKSASSRPVDFAQSSSVADSHTLGNSSMTSDNIVPDQSSSSLAPGHVLSEQPSLPPAPGHISKCTVPAVVVSTSVADTPSVTSSPSSLSPAPCDSPATPSPPVTVETPIASPPVAVKSPIVLHSPVSNPPFDDAPPFSINELLFTPTLVLLTIQHTFPLLDLMGPSTLPIPVHQPLSDLISLFQRFLSSMLTGVPFVPFVSHSGFADSAITAESSFCPFGSSFLLF
ncbi:hypothetical protein CKK34_5968 [Yarrowia sp. E02]|nr:hypothetical protein CKK34_5968 [Yarrowia sp. E02]